MTDGQRLRAAKAALEHTSYGEMCKDFDRLEQQAREADVEDPQDLAQAQFYLAHGFDIDDAFTVYMVTCAREGKAPVLTNV
jgi:hypothetical protein